jgi:hypothetical protein
MFDDVLSITKFKHFLIEYNLFIVSVSNRGKNLMILKPQMKEFGLNEGFIIEKQPKVPMPL